MHDSCLSIWSNFSWPLNRLSDDFFLKAKVLEVFQPGAHRSTGRFKAWGLGKLHLKLLISYDICKEHENKKTFTIHLFCSWISNPRLIILPTLVPKVKYIAQFFYVLFFYFQDVKRWRFTVKILVFTFKKEFQSMGFAFPILRNKTHSYERKKIVRQSLLTYRKWKTGRAKNSSQRRTSIHEQLPSPISTRDVWRICFSVPWPKKPEQTEQH